MSLALPCSKSSAPQLFTHPSEVHSLAVSCTGPLILVSGRTSASYSILHSTLLRLVRQALTTSPLKNPPQKSRLDTRIPRYYPLQLPRRSQNARSVYLRT